MEVNAIYSQELMVNHLRLVMIDRMLKEKYNEIEYLAIQPSRDPSIVEINQNDLDWLLSEHEKCELMEQQYREEIERYGVLERQYREEVERCGVLEQQYQDMVNSNTWRWGVRLRKVYYFLSAPMRVLKNISK